MYKHSGSCSQNHGNPCQVDIALYEVDPYRGNGRRDFDGQNHIGGDSNWQTAVKQEEGLCLHCVELFRSMNSKADCSIFAEANLSPFCAKSKSAFQPGL